jgi:hypothetical protein
VSDDQRTTPPGSSSGGTPANCTTQPCPLACQCGDTRWLDTQAFCGDEARLQCNLTGNCPDGPATVEILNGATVIATLNAQLRGRRVDATWVAKAPTANWRTDRITFRVRAAGQTCQSSNEFTFKARPTIARALKATNRGTPAGFADIWEVVDQALEADRVHYWLKVKLTPPTGAAALPWNAAKQTAEDTRIETIWNNGFSAKRFHRTACRRLRACDCAFDCCKAGFHLDFDFVASGEHYAVQIRTAAAPRASGTSRTGSFWADPPRAVTTTYPHEVGHMLGNFDEYAGGAHDPSGVQPSGAGADNLMKTAGNTTLFNMHYRWVLEYLNANSGGDTYEIIPP